MASSNPAFTNSPAFNSQASSVAAAKLASPSADQLNDLYDRPSATPQQTDRMTYDDVLVKIGICFAVLLLGAAIGFVFPVLMWPGLIAGLVLGLVNVFKKKPSPGLILGYAVAEGLFVGGISNMYATLWNGIIPQAVLGTLAVVAVTLFLFMSGRVRASKRATQIFLVAMVGYMVFSLVNFGLVMFGATESMFGLRGIEVFGIPLGVIIGVLVVIMAAYSLVLDFENIKTGVQQGAPRVYSWTAAFGILVTVVWLYLEILRLLAILRGNE